MTLPRRGGLRERVSREEWNLGIVHQPIDDIVARGIVGQVEWLPPQSRWRGLADPSCYSQPDGRVMLFAERLNHLTGRGEIWSATVAPDGNPALATFQPWAQAKTHLSYPFPFTFNDLLYYTMENSESGRLTLWRHLPNRWHQRVLLERPAIDPTIWHDSNGWWLFCTFADDQPDTKLHLFYADDVLGPWHPHPGNPVLTNLASARPAGPLFVSNGRLIRPSQDSTRTYGGALVLNDVDVLSRQQFVERPIRRLEPIAPYGDGLHTICAVRDQTIIDGKRWAFHFLDPLRYPITGSLNRYRRRRRNDQVQFEGT